MDKTYINQLKGICSVLVTPLKEDETLDKEGFSRLITYQRENNLDSIFVCGASGEGPALSNDIRADALSIALDNFIDKPVIIGVFESGTKKAAETIKGLLPVIKEKDRKDVVFMVAPPIYFSPSHNETEILDFYRSIGSIGFPIMIYSNTKYTGLALTLKQIETLSKEKNIIGIKFTKEPMDILEDLVKLKNTRDKDFVIGFAKNDLVKAFELGVDMLINTMAGLIPKTFSNLYLCFKEGDTEKARLLEKEINSFGKVYNLGPGFIASAKTASSIIVNCDDYMSKPFQRTSIKQRIDIKSFIDNTRLTYPIFQ